MAIIIDTTTGNTKSHRLVKEGTPRIEAALSTQIVAGVDGASHIRLTISGAADPAELVQALQAVTNKVKNLYGLA